MSSPRHLRLIAPPLPWFPPARPRPPDGGSFGSYCHRFPFPFLFSFPRVSRTRSSLINCACTSLPTPISNLSSPSPVPPHLYNLAPLASPDVAPIPYETSFLPSHLYILTRCLPARERPTLRSFRPSLAMRVRRKKSKYPISRVLPRDTCDCCL